MEIVIEQSSLREFRDTYQDEVPSFVKCRKCKNKAIIIMQVKDTKGELIDQRPVDATVWMHDASVVNIYLCTNCGAMRANWNQG